MTTCIAIQAYDRVGSQGALIGSLLTQTVQLPIVASINRGGSFPRDLLSTTTVVRLMEEEVHPDRHFLHLLDWAFDKYDRVLYLPDDVILAPSFVRLMLTAFDFFKGARVINCAASCSLDRKQKTMITRMDEGARTGEGFWSMLARMDERFWSGDNLLLSKTQWARLRHFYAAYDELFGSPETRDHGAIRAWFKRQLDNSTLTPDQIATYRTGQSGVGSDAAIEVACILAGIKPASFYVNRLINIGAVFDRDSTRVFQHNKTKLDVFEQDETIDTFFIQ